MATKNNNNQLTFVFEVCGQCSTHQWNTRHEEAKYVAVFEQVSACIKTVVPNAICVMNKVPKPWFEKEIYCQLIPNEDDNNPYYDVLPRIGAFEVSTVIDNVDILFYSKMMSTMWPHASSLAARIKDFADMNGSTAVATLKEKFQTTGRQVRQARLRGQASVSTMSLYSKQAESQQTLKELPKAEETNAPAQQQQPDQQQQAAEQEQKQAADATAAAAKEDKKKAKAAATAPAAVTEEAKQAAQQPPAQATAAAAGGAKVLLGYWNVRGISRGNPARYLLAFSKANWEEKTWPIVDPVEKGWTNAKPTLMDFANLPYIIDGDFKISETKAVHQYIAAKYCPSLLGSTPQQKARAYQLQCIADEAAINCIKLCFQNAATTKEQVTAKFMEQLPTVGKLLDDGREFLTGTTPVIADFILFAHIEYANHLTGNQTYATYPKLEAFYNRMENLAGLKEFRASPQYAETAQRWIPEIAKVDIN